MYPASILAGDFQAVALKCLTDTANNYHVLLWVGMEHNLSRTVELNQLWTGTGTDAHHWV